jgi:hypothetical protein
LTTEKTKTIIKENIKSNKSYPLPNLAPSPLERAGERN